MFYYGGLGPAIVGVCWAFFPNATMLLVLRTYTYFYVVNSKGGWALIWASVAYALALCSSSIFTIAAAYGLGNHQRIVELSPHLPNAILDDWVAANLDSFSVGFLKLSVLSYLLDIQGPTHRLGRWTLYLAVSINFILYISNAPLIFLVSEPVKKLWNSSVPGQCPGEHREYVFAILTGAWGAATDLLLALYPVMIVYNLKIRLKLKLSLCVLMGLGVFTAVCSVAKTILFNRLSESSTGSDSTCGFPQSRQNPFEEKEFADSGGSQDVVAPLVIWGIMEMWIGFLATNVAPLWPLLKRSGIQKRHKGVAPGLPMNFSARNPFARLRKLPDPSSHPDHPSDIDDDGYLGSVAFQRLGSRGASQEIAAHPAGIELTTEFMVTSGKASKKNAESELGNTSIGGVCV